MTVKDLQARIRLFAEERDWEKFHSPKNLIMAMTGEVGELAEIFQWLDEAQAAAVMSNPNPAQSVREELADVFCYLLRLADVLHVDLEDAALAKIEINRDRYPVDQVRGSAVKYTQLGPTP